MTDADLLPPALLKRKAVVYVRQSTQAQVQLNLESQRRQYELVDEARRRGFRDVEVIDDDLGRSASGAVARPGFEEARRLAVRRRGWRRSLLRRLAARQERPRLASPSGALWARRGARHRSRRCL